MKNFNYYIYIKPQIFLQLSLKSISILYYFLILFLCCSVYLIFIFAPADLLQNFNYRIIFLHVPLAWYSIFLYCFLALFSLFFLIYKYRFFYFFAKISSIIGLIFTLLTLITGCLWGIPMWGTFWVWDARLTSVLILFFLYVINYILNLNSYNIAYLESAAILALFGLLNIPIIKYSVVWWNTLHQPASISEFKLTIHIFMLLPIFSVMLVLGCFIVLIYCYKMRQYILDNKYILLKNK